MLSEILEAYKRWKDYLLLEHKKEIYLFRSIRFGQIATATSAYESFLVDKSSDFLDVTPTQTVKISDTLEFAVNEDHICFARIEGNVYYPVDSWVAEANLKSARRFERLARYSVLRILAETTEGLNIMNHLVGIKLRLGDVIEKKLYLTIRDRFPVKSGEKPYRKTGNGQEEKVVRKLFGL